MFSLRQISLAYGEKILFRTISFSLTAGDRVGLVGRNGSGKTTLLRLFNGEEVPDEGQVEAASRATVGYLPQDGLATAGRTMREECLLAFPKILELREKLKTLERQLGQSSQNGETRSLLHAITEIEHELHLAGSETLEARIERVTRGLGFESSDLERDTCTFSGGWQMRIALAKLLLAEPDLLLLDEPTNHLDLEAQEWLEAFLRNYAGAFLVISHDRGFLDAVTNRTLHLTQGNIEDYRMRFSDFEAAAIERREQALRSVVREQRERARVERFIERFRYKATKARQVQSRLKSLARLGEMEVENEEGSINFHFPDPPRGPLRVAEMVGVDKRYGPLQILNQMHFRMERGEKIAIVGRNGRGKSTFARILAGVEAPDCGQVLHGPGIRIGWFAQNQTQILDPGQTVLQSAESVCADGAERLRVRSLLGAFLFRGKEVEKKVAILSGGEKNRLALVRILLSKANLLILDEPINHLDIPSKTILQAALMDYAGAVVLVAHDKDFVEPIADRIVAFEETGILTFNGPLSAYLQDREKRLQPEVGGGEDSTTAVSPKVGGTSGKEDLSPKDRRRAAAMDRARLAPLKKAVSEWEGRIEGLETEIANLEKRLADPAFFQTGEAPGAVKRHLEARNELDEALEQWESLSGELQSAQSADDPT